MVPVQRRFLGCLALLAALCAAAGGVLHVAELALYLTPCCLIGALLLSGRFVGNRVRLRSGLRAGNCSATVRWLSTDGHVQSRTWRFKLRRATQPRRAGQPLSSAAWATGRVARRGRVAAKESVSAATQTRAMVAPGGVARW